MTFQHDSRTGSTTGVQILAVVGYTAFAIPVSIVAIGEFGVLGLGLAAFLGWQWTQVIRIGSGNMPRSSVARLGPQVGPAETPPDASEFDAYRASLIDRLEDEQRSFDGFVTRLRDARDLSEFDAFMDEREARNRASAGLAL